MVESCRRHGKEPLAYLRDVLARLPAMTNQDDLAPLLPSQLGKACAYLLEHWGALSAHCDHPVTRLDTNLVENAIRPTAVGKKNWLFIGHPAAGERAAIIYSLVESCRRHGKEPLAYCATPSPVCPR